ncbi:DUF1918 domain-containing protein [Georgenia yuyongxinii]|uniref:DUF1918 domain-containing protein n=1 Tax=Georgenia yuyongxinii TaxID=2589797 RepID=A0A5B8CAN7_9MICO|nr:DUF1918 domain-containing protein [Georgenia yuyongxinii]QDC25176.1 DUF1918 domain-containing protein [Georgenia yuyongxinii]
MRANLGDHIVLAAGRVGEAVRDGEILEVKGVDGAPPYKVRWSDGREGIVFPGPDAELRGADAAAGGGAAGRSTTEPIHEWQVRVSIFESGDETTAKVALISDSIFGLNASGGSRRHEGDPTVRRIGDEIAVARALRHLADQMLAMAGHDVEGATGEPGVHIRPE